MKTKWNESSLLFVSHPCHTADQKRLSKLTPDVVPFIPLTSDSTEPPGADSIQDGGVTKAQIILELTMQDWEDAIDLYGIESSLIPDRPAIQPNPSTSKNVSHIPLPFTIHQL
jgi:hypothetical protein